MTSQIKTPPGITLYRGWNDPGCYVWSPFVTKVEARLRFSGVTYHTDAGSVTQAPRGKIPYVAISQTASSDGKPVDPALVADSTLIIRNLVDNGVLEDVNAKISPTDGAHDLALRALLEDKLYFFQSYEKWHQNYYTMRPHILSALPYPVQVVVGLLAYRKVSQTLFGQGTARFSEEELSSFKQQIWESINALLVASRMSKVAKDDGGTVFWVLGGERPSEVDATLYGFIASALICTAAPESQRMVRGFPAVVDYAQRIHDKYFPDYACWGSC